MCTATAPRIQRSFRLIDDNIVSVKFGDRTTRYVLAIGVAADWEGNPETVVALRSGREMLHVTVARDASAMCHCPRHFNEGECWHAQLAVAILKHLEAGKPEEPAPAPEAPTLPTLEVADADGKPICRIESENGIWKSHTILANLIRSKPFLIANPEQREALEASSIPDTRILFTAV